MRKKKMKKSLKEIINIIELSEQDKITSKRGNTYIVHKVDKSIIEDLQSRVYNVNVQIHKVNNLTLKAVSIIKKRIHKNYYLIEK